MTWGFDSGEIESVRCQFCTNSDLCKRRPKSAKNARANTINSINTTRYHSCPHKLMACEVPRYSSLSVCGNHLMLLTSTGRVVFYGDCGVRRGLPTYPTVVCLNMQQQIHLTRIVTSCENWAFFDEDDEFYLARHGLHCHPMHIPREMFGGQKVTDVAFGTSHLLFSTSDNSLFVGRFNVDSFVDGHDVDSFVDGHDVDLSPFAEILGNICEDSMFDLSLIHI